MQKILVVDDIEVNRNLLEYMLKSIGDFEIINAVNGLEAIKLFQTEKPDLILMDVNMPEMDGYESATEIKGFCINEYTPIIFITALSSEASLTHSLSSGGDDFISKPFSAEVLESKVNVHLRIRELTLQLTDKNKSLTDLNHQLFNDKELIEHFFVNALQQSFLDVNIIKYHMSSLSTFNGDLFLVQRGPEGGLYLIMGDFSGHGLTAAMGTLPVALVFFKMVDTGAAVGNIARELNFELNKLMPPSMFFAATLLELNARGDVMTVWMGGVPESYCLSEEGDLKEIIHSQHMPLGILDDSEFDTATQVFDVEKNNKIYLYSDGVVESKNPAGEQFGDDRLKEILVSENTNRFDKVLNGLNIFIGENNQNDDITLVELTCQAIPAAKVDEDVIKETSILPWQLSVSLSAKEIRQQDAVSKLSEILAMLPALERHKGVLHILLSEMYSNSIDHSILGLESANKDTDEHFVNYYESRDKKIQNLKDAFINFDFKLLEESEQHYLQIRISDSGKGYHGNDSGNSEDLLYGRGLSIIISLCEKISFLDDGKTLEVLFQL
jgi:CheY-like chemotaxis protein